MCIRDRIWTQQFYNYVVRDWLEGDPAMPPPPHERKHGRNANWTHVFNDDVLSMPDAWEYPWYAAWDLAFHVIPFGLIDPEFAKGQLIQLTREWYMHPNGQLPAYEWAFDDVNPPVPVSYTHLDVYKRQPIHDVPSLWARDAFSGSFALRSNGPMLSRPRNPP